MALGMAMSLAACSSQSTASSTQTQKTQTLATGTSLSAVKTSQKNADDEKTLVVYFSCNDTTQAAAENIAEQLKADLYEILPEEPYTEDDLDFYYSESRVSLEMNDETARPAIAGTPLDLGDYDTVIIGYPIWNNTMPRIINSFVEAYDLTGKTVLPFCTSDESGVAQSVNDLRDAVQEADVKDGLRVADPHDSTVTQWLAENGLLGA